jgi:hypothetical protein
MVAMLFMAAGCAGIKTVSRTEWPQEKVALTPELVELYHEVGRSAGAVDALDGYADIHIKTPKRDEKVYCNLQLHRSQDSRFIVSAGLLGWPVADMFIRKDSLFVHDMINNIMLVGKNNEENIEKIIGIHSGFGFLSESLLGMVSMPEPDKAIESVRKGAGKVSYTVRYRYGKKELLINPAEKVMEALTLFDVNGRRVVEVHFRNFETVTLKQRPVRVPKEIDMILPDYRYDGNGEHQLVVAYDQRVINPPEFRVRFRKPANAKLVNLEEVGMLPWL